MLGWSLKNKLWENRSMFYQHTESKFSAIWSRWQTSINVFYLCSDDI